MLLKVSNFFNIGKLEPDFKLFPNVYPYSCFVVHFSFQFFISSLVQNCFLHFKSFYILPFISWPALKFFKLWT